MTRSTKRALENSKGGEFGREAFTYRDQGRKLKFFPFMNNHWTHNCKHCEILIQIQRNASEDQAFWWRVEVPESDVPDGQRNAEDGYAATYLEAARLACEEAEKLRNPRWLPKKRT